MEAEREDGQQKMHFLEEELAETSNKSDETVSVLMPYMVITG